MSAFLAIVGDTWRQSRKQVVFIIMLVLLALTAAVVVAAPKVHVDAQGNRAFGFLFVEKPVDALEEAWIQSYAQTLMVERGETMLDFSEKGDEARTALREAEREARELAAGIPPFQRSVEMWLMLAASVIFSLSMVLFIAACAGYFPDLLSSGAVDLVLSKPLSRAQILLGKYFGGLALYTAAILATYAVLYAGIGMRTGIWHPRLFLAAPLQVFSAGVLFAILAWVGIRLRSTALALVLGYFFYLVVDSALGALVTLQRMGVLKELAWLDRGAEITRLVLPNFGLLKEFASSSVLNLPAVDWTPILVAAAWLVLMLGLAYSRFRRSDY